MSGKAILRCSRALAMVHAVARRLRITQAGFYHVAARAPEGEKLFADEVDYVRFETELRRVVAEGDFRCLAVCALTTHYHLIVETDDGALPRGMKKLNQRFAHAHNVRHGRRGHAFSERYLSVLLKDTEQLLTAFRYVARNPVEAGLCGHPGDWTWSSYAPAVGRPGRFAFAELDYLLRCCDESLGSLRRFVEVESGV